MLWLLVPVLVFGGVGCKKKQSAGDPGNAAAPATAPKDPSTAPSNPSQPSQQGLSAEKRGEMVGFAAHLPQSTEFLISVHDGSKAARRIMGSKMWSTFAQMSGMPIGAGMDELGEEAVEEIATGPAMMLGMEFTLAMGQGTSEQLKHLVQLNKRLNFFQMSGFVRSMSEALGEEDSANMDRHFGQFSKELLRNLIQDGESGVGLFEKLNMPPTYVAFKTSDENRETVNQQLAAGMQIFGMLDEMVEVVTIERGDSTFNGYKLMGSKIAAEMADDRSEMDEAIGTEYGDRLIKAVSEKDLYVAHGIYGKYVVLFIGSSEDQLAFADDAGSSLAAGDALAFCDDYESKDLLAVFYGQDEALKSIMDKAKGSFADVSAGLRDGLSASDHLGDTRNLEALLRMVEEREAALQAMSKVHGGGTIAFFDDGLKIESYGGYDAGYSQWDAPNKLAPLGSGEGVMLFANMTSNAEYDAKLRAYIEALLETAYNGAMKAAELPIKDADFAEFKNYVHLFDTKFRPDLLAFWESFSNGFNGSLGQERALIIDLNGGLPAVPGLPQAMVDEGKFPRISWIAPVVDRTKLGGSWEKMNASMTSMIGTISEMVGKDIPMQKPLSSEKNGATTWFFPLPFFNDDFVPSVTVNDAWFAASTSKMQAVDLLAKAEAGGEATNGFVMECDFKQLHKYANEMVMLMLKNREDMGISAGDIEMANQVIGAFSELDAMSIHVRRDEGQLRSSFHFKTR